MTRKRTGDNNRIEIYFHIQIAKDLEKSILLCYLICHKRKKELKIGNGFLFGFIRLLGPGPLFPVSTEYIQMTRFLP